MLKRDPLEVGALLLSSSSSEVLEATAPLWTTVVPLLPLPCQRTGPRFCPTRCPCGTRPRDVFPSCPWKRKLDAEPMALGASGSLRTPQRKDRDKRMKDHERENQNVSRPLSFTPPPSSDRQRREDVLLFIFLIIFLIIIFLFLIFIFILFFSGCQERLDEERLVDRKELLDERRLCDPEREAKDAGKGQKEAHNLV